MTVLPADDRHLWLSAGTTDPEECDVCSYPRSDTSVHLPAADPASALLEAPVPAPMVDLDLDQVAAVLTDLLTAVNAMRGETPGA